METDLVVSIAQIATGLATLVVAMFLAGQLIIQRRHLEIAQQDSVRNLGFAASTRNEEISLARLTNRPLLESYMNAGEAQGTQTKIDSHIFFNYMRLMYLQMINEWNLGVNDNNVEYFKGRLGVLMGTVGERGYYVSNGRIIVNTVFGLEELTRLGDIVYEELEGSPVPA